MEVIRQLSPPSSFHLQRYKKIPKLPNFFPTFFIFFPKRSSSTISANARRYCLPQYPPISADFHPILFPPTPADFRPISAVTRRLPPDFRRRRVLPRVRPPAANVHGEIKYTGCGLTRGKTLQRRGLRYENTRHIYGLRSYTR